MQRSLSRGFTYFVAGVIVGVVSVAPAAAHPSAPSATHHTHMGTDSTE